MEWRRSANRSWAVVVLAGLIAAVGGLGAAPARAQSTEQDQVTKHLHRANNRAIQSRVIRRVRAALPEDAELARGSLWYRFNYNNVTDDEADSIALDINMYQNQVGGDAAIGRLIAGFSFGYTLADSKLKDEIDMDPDRREIESDNYTFTPYLAYLLTDKFFLQLLGGYTLSDPDELRPGSRRDDTDTGFYELSGNVVHDIERLSVGAHLGYRYTATDFDPPSGSDVDDFLEVYTVVMGIGAGLDFGRFDPYVSGTIEHRMAERGKDSTSGVIEGGLRAEVIENLSVAVGVVGEIGDELTDSIGTLVELQYTL